MFKYFERKNLALQFVSVSLLIQILSWGYMTSNFQGNIGWIVSRLNFMNYWLFFLSGIYIWRNESRMIDLISTKSLAPFVIGAIACALIVTVLQTSHFVEKQTGSSHLDATLGVLLSATFALALYRLSRIVEDRKETGLHSLSSIGRLSNGIYLIHGLTMQIVVIILASSLGLTYSNILSIRLSSWRQHSWVGCQCFSWIGYHTRMFFLELGFLGKSRIRKNPQLYSTYHTILIAENT